MTSVFRTHAQCWESGVFVILRAGVTTCCYVSSLGTSKSYRCSRSLGRNLVTRANAMGEERPGTQGLAQGQGLWSSGQHDSEH